MKKYENNSIVEEEDLSINDYDEMEEIKELNPNNRLLRLKKAQTKPKLNSFDANKPVIDLSFAKSANKTFREGTTPRKSDIFKPEDFEGIPDDEGHVYIK